MATPPGGPSTGNWSYGPGQGQGDGSANGYGYPSVPNHRQPYAPQGPGPSPYDQPQAPRIQPVQPQRRTPEPAPAGASNNPLVRPYAMTGGRTRPRYQLAIEAVNAKLSLLRTSIKGA